ncbi:MAG TPA: phosphoglycerate mutase, partial [Nitrosomonas sp.]|nr:phosphoglycerate mutase [Nitrosomonas sp.]
MNLHLFIPSLFWSDRTCPEIYHELPMPSLEILLSKSKVSTSPASDLSTWLCQTFNIEKQLDWPVAPIMLHADCSDQTVATN